MSDICWVTSGCIGVGFLLVVLFILAYSHWSLHNHDWRRHHWRYINDEGDVCGPFTRQQMRAKVLNSDIDGKTYVAMNSFSQYIPAEIAFPKWEEAFLEIAELNLPVEDSDDELEMRQNKFSHFYPIGYSGQQSHPSFYAAHPSVMQQHPSLLAHPSLITHPSYVASHQNFYAQQASFYAKHSPQAGVDPMMDGAGGDGVEMSARPSKRASNEWYYLDAQDVARGPFTDSQMNTWWNSGRFDKETEIKNGLNADYKTIEDVFPDTVLAFPVQPRANAKTPDHSGIYRINGLAASSPSPAAVKARGPSSHVSKSLKPQIPEKVVELTEEESSNPDPKRNREIDLGSDFHSGEEEHAKKQRARPKHKVVKKHHYLDEDHRVDHRV